MYAIVSSKIAAHAADSEQHSGASQIGTTAWLAPASASTSPRCSTRSHRPAKGRKNHGGEHQPARPEHLHHVRRHGSVRTMNKAMKGENVSLL